MLAGVWGIFLLILAILWVLVPFAIFGIKSLLRQLIAEQRRTNDLLLQQRMDAAPPEVAIPEFKQPGTGFFS